MGSRREQPTVISHTSASNQALVRPIPGKQWDNVVVVVGTCFWDGTPLLERHISSRLTAYAPVLFVEPPTSVLSRFRNQEAGRLAPEPGLRLVDERLAVLSVRLPPLKDRVWAKGCSLRLFKRALRRAVTDLGGPTVHAMVVTSLDPVLHALDERFSVYYAKDDYVAGAALLGIPVTAVRSYVAQLCGNADIVVAVSPHLADTFGVRGVPASVIPNGCDPGLFSIAGPPSTSQPGVAAFVGHLSDRVDLSLLEALASRGTRVRIIGGKQETLTGTRFESLLTHPAVDWIGHVSYDALPRVLSDVTTCLLPYSTSAFNLASFPLKILEYLAAGRRVVSTDLPAVRWLDTDLVVTADGAAAFSTAVEDSLRSPLGDPEIQERKAFAAGHNWDDRTWRLAQILGLVKSDSCGTTGVTHRGNG